MFSFCNSRDILCVNGCPLPRFFVKPATTSFMRAIAATLSPSAPRRLARFALLCVVHQKRFSRRRHACTIICGILPAVFQIGGHCETCREGVVVQCTKQLRKSTDYFDKRHPSTRFITMGFLVGCHVGFSHQCFLVFRPCTKINLSDCYHCAGQRDCDADPWIVSMTHLAA